MKVFSEEKERTANVERPWMAEYTRMWAKHRRCINKLMVFERAWIDSEIRITSPYLMDDLEVDSMMSEILKETTNSKGTPLLIYKNYKYDKSGTSIGGGVHWRCVNRKCHAYINTEGLPNQRFIVDSELSHNHKPHDEGVDVQERRRSFQALGKRKLIEDDNPEPRKVVAAETSNSKALSKEKGFFRTISFARRRHYRRGETIATCSSAEVNAKVKEENESDPETTSQDDSNPVKEDENQYLHLHESYSFPRQEDVRIRDEFDVSGWMYGNQLRGLDPHQRFIAEKLVGDVIFKARLRMLNVNSRIE